MPPDPKEISLCRKWLIIAASDLRAALVLNQAFPPLIDQALYLCLQCAEKTLKAFLVWHEAPFPRTHKLDELGLRCAAIDRSLEHAIVDLAGLVAAYDSWIDRYPGTAVIEPTAEDADDAYRQASDIMRSILARLPAEVAP